MYLGIRLVTLYRVSGKIYHCHCPVHDVMTSKAAFEACCSPQTGLARRLAASSNGEEEMSCDSKWLFNHVHFNWKFGSEFCPWQHPPSVSRRCSSPFIASCVRCSFDFAESHNSSAMMSWGPRRHAGANCHDDMMQLETLQTTASLYTQIPALYMQSPKFLHVLLFFIAFSKVHLSL